MHAMTLHAQADLWQHGATTFAALFMEGEMRSPDTEANRTDVLLYAVMHRGLRLTTDLPRLALGPRPGWAIHLNPAGTLTLTWPHVQPLLLDAPLNLPTGWHESAAEHDLVLLFVGEGLGLREHTENHQTNPGKRSPQAAERGELAAGAITYPCQQLAAGRSRRAGGVRSAKHPRFVPAAGSPTQAASCGDRTPETPGPVRRPDAAVVRADRTGWLRCPSHRPGGHGRARR